MNNLFSMNPTVLVSRSKWNVPGGGVKNSYNTGYLVPDKWLEVMPGETLSITVNDVTRSTTPINPVMDLAVKDYFAFFIPFRLICDHWKQIWGESKHRGKLKTKYVFPGITPPTDYWYEETYVTEEEYNSNKTSFYTYNGDYVQETSNSVYDSSKTYYERFQGWQKGTLADHLGLPTKVLHRKVSHAPFRSYALVYNEFFRDQNNIEATAEYFDDSDRVGTNGDNPDTDPVLGGKLLKVAKFHDLFTSLMPEVNKFEDVTIPLGEYAPVVTAPENNTIVSGNQLLWKHTNGSDINRQSAIYFSPSNATTYNGSNSVSQDSLYAGVVPSNLVTDLSLASSANVNDLIYAYKLSILYQKMTRSGTRYIETLRNIFGVISSDASLQRPQYLGGFQFQITQTEIPQTSSTNDISPQGNLAAYSNSGCRDQHLFTHSFDEHGIVLILSCVRTLHSYSQGINKNWFHFEMEDFYNPQMANISDQKVMMDEIYATGTETDNEVLGFAEAWYEYRYDPDLITGEFRPNYRKNGGLSRLHYGDYFTSKPTLGADFINETDVNVDRTLTVSSKITDQWYSDIKFNITAVKPMPLRSFASLSSHF